jgi:hypothetical protein
LTATPLDAHALALLQLLAEGDGVSLPRAARHLSLSQSELQRLLTALGPDPRFDGFDLVAVRDEGERRTLWLTDKGRDLCRSA